MTDLEIAIIIAIAVVSALVKAITGAGFPMLVVPVLALFIDVADAVVVVAIPNVTMNGAIFWSLRHERGESPTLPRFLVTTSVGAVIGSVLLSVLSETVLRLGLIGVIVLFVANRLSSRRFTLNPARALHLAPAAGAASGIVFGATAVSGPLVTPWFLSQDLRRDVYLMSISAAFSLAGAAQIGFFVVRGAFTTNFVLGGLGLVALSWAMLPLGARLRDRLDIETFERLVLLLLVISGISLFASIV
ncbi:MAG: TSUP family transporter [Acidimicrobiales bacterium]